MLQQVGTRSPSLSLRLAGHRCPSGSCQASQSEQGEGQPVRTDPGNSFQASLAVGPEAVTKALFRGALCRIQISFTHCQLTPQQPCNRDRQVEHFSAQDLETPRGERPLGQVRREKNLLGQVSGPKLNAHTLRRHQLHSPQPSSLSQNLLSDRVLLPRSGAIYLIC